MSLSLEAVRKLVPKSYRGMITKEFIDKIESSVGDSIIAEQIKDNFITYIGVLSSGKYKIEDYIAAVKYVSYKLLGYSNVKAYAATFPDRYQKLKDNNQQIDAFVSMYNKGKLVMQIFEQTLIPTYVLNAPLHQEALNELAKMIKDPSVKGMAKVKACEAILQHTKQPDVIKGELTIGIEQQDTIAELRDVVEQLAEANRLSLERSVKSLKEVAEANIIDVPVLHKELE